MKYTKNILRFTVLILVVFLVAVFGLYGKTFSSLSTKTEDWAAFGSLLSGCFTIVAGIATSATLLFLVIEHLKKQRSERLTEVKAEMSLFFDVLNQLELQYDNRFKFKDKLGLFHRCSNNLCIHKNPTQKDKLCSFISKLKSKCDHLATYSDTEFLPKINETNFISEVCEIILDDLGLFITCNQHGAIMLPDYNTGLQADNIEESLAPVFDIVSKLSLLYEGTPYFPPEIKLNETLFFISFLESPPLSSLSLYDPHDFIKHSHKTMERIFKENERDKPTDKIYNYLRYTLYENLNLFDSKEGITEFRTTLNINLNLLKNQHLSSATTNILNEIESGLLQNFTS